MGKLEKPDSIAGFFWRLDSIVSSAVFETFAWLKNAGSAYSSFLYRFRIKGPRRVVIDLIDDAATFGTMFAFVLLAFALPPFSGTGDIWNKGREYAVTFTDVNGEIVGRRGIRQDDAIPLSDVPQHMINAVLATEDARFFDHFGVDVIGTFRAIIQNARANDVVQGGSSLTQQVAKNLFLSPERTMRRKIHEAFLALWIEARLSKEEILKLYLDRSYLGGGAYGVEAAAQNYFGKSIRDVNLAEAAMLAGLFKAPSKYAPHVNFDSARARANVVLYRMLDSGYINQGELLEARREPAQIVSLANLDSPDWYLDWAYRDTLALLEEQNLTGEYVIEVKTTVDTRLQAVAQKVINEALEFEAPAFDASQASVAILQPDGAVKALIGGRDYETSQFNRATDALRQPGSSFKPFVYLAALLNGFTPDTIVVDAPVSIGAWSPKNYTKKYAGRTTLTSALAHSYNSIPVQLMLKVGRKKIIETAHNVGLLQELDNVPSLPLGTSAVTLLDMTTAYATFAGGGKRAKAYTVLEIRRPNGDVLYDRAKNAPAPVQAVPEEKIAELNSMMNAVVRSGTGRRADLGFMPQAGKTGTNQSYRDAWYIGYTAHYVTGVWFGNDDFAEMKKMTGGTLPAASWKRIMTVAEQTQQAEGLAGVPLDDSYAKFVAENQPEIEIIAPPPDSGSSDRDRAEQAKSERKSAEVADTGEPRIYTPPARARTAVRERRVSETQRIDPPRRVQRERARQTRVASVEQPRRRKRARVIDIPDEDVAVVRPRRSSDPVVRVLQDVFSIFDDDTPRKKVRRKKSLELPEVNLGKKYRRRATLDRLRQTQGY